MWPNMDGLLVWMIIAHVAFLIVPGMMLLTYEWFQNHSAGKSKPTDLLHTIPIQRKPVIPKAA